MAPDYAIDRQNEADSAAVNEGSQEVGLQTCEQRDFGAHHTLAAERAVQNERQPNACLLELEGGHLLRLLGIT